MNGSDRQRNSCAITTSTADHGSFLHINPVLSEVVQSIQDRIDNDGFHPDNVQTGIRRFDRQIGGLRRGELTIVTGHPESCRRSFAFQVARHVATENSLPVCVFSPRIPAHEVGLRILVAQGKLNHKRTPSGDLSDDEWRRMNLALGALHESPIFINESKSLSSAELSQSVRKQLGTQARIGLVLIDSVENLLADSVTRKRSNCMKELLAQLRRLAEETDVPILATLHVTTSVNTFVQGCGRFDELRYLGIDEHVGMLVSIYPENKQSRTTSAGNTAVNLQVYEPLRGRNSSIDLTYLEESLSFLP